MALLDGSIILYIMKIRFVGGRRKLATRRINRIIIIYLPAVEKLLCGRYNKSSITVALP